MRVLTWIILLSALAAPTAYASPPQGDPYTPLRLYAGQWRLTPEGKGKALVVDNHCARTGLFFACEQVVDGKPADRVVFLPKGETAQGQVYRTQAMDADGVTAHPWSDLTIKGNDWVYSNTKADVGKPVRHRTLNHFSGPDHIHFDVQSSVDGSIWTTEASGDEQRVR